MFHKGNYSLTRTQFGALSPASALHSKEIGAINSDASYSSQ